MTDSETNDAIPGEAQPAKPEPTSPGMRLAAAREAHGWSIEQVASYLKLAPRQVVAIEQDDYAALPGMAIVRGFVRSYAKLLKIDAAPLLAQLGGETVLAQEPLRPKEGLSAPFSEARLPSMSEKPAMSSKWVIGVLLALLLAAAFWAFRDVAGPVQQPVAPPIVTEPAVPVDTVEAPLQPQPEESAPGAETGPVPEVAAPAPEATIPAAPAPPAAPAAPAPPVVPAPAVPAAGGGDTLSLAVREESWIEIRRTEGGGVVMARLAQPGENIAVEIGEPVVLVVGNAAGVDATLRGEPLSVKGSTKTNVARLALK